MPLLQVRHVTKLYQTEGNPVPALRDVSLEVEAGAFIAVVGRSGCGKSTLLNLCGAMDFPSTGEVSIDGETTSRLSDAALTRLRRLKVGFIFQSFQLLNTLSVIENVELPLLLARTPDARRTGLARLASLGIEEYAHRLPHQLSGGQQQRVAIARALAHTPKLILADEPTGNLDTATGEQILQLLREMTRSSGVSVIMATHSPESAEYVDQVIRMRDGQRIA